MLAIIGPLVTTGLKDVKLGLGLFAGYHLIEDQAKIGLTASGYFF